MQFKTARRQVEPNAAVCAQCAWRGGRTSARTWSKMGSSTLSKTRAQKGGVNAAPWNFSVSNSTCIAWAQSEAHIHAN